MDGNLEVLANLTNSQQISEFFLGYRITFENFVGLESKYVEL